MARIPTFAVLLCAACSSPEPDLVGGPPTITSEGVGCARLGATVADVHADCHMVRDTALTLEGMGQEALLLDLHGAAVMAEIEGGRVWRVSVLDAGPMTSDSLGVGSPARSMSALGAEDLREASPSVRVSCVLIVGECRTLR